jgi:hypothetical protein
MALGMEKFLSMGRFIPNILLAILLFVPSLAQAESRDSYSLPASEHAILANTISIKKSIQISNYQPHVVNHIRRNMQDHHNAAMRDIRKRASLNQKRVRLN